MCPEESSGQCGATLREARWLANDKTIGADFPKPVGYSTVSSGY